MSEETGYVLAEKLRHVVPSDIVDEFLGFLEAGEPFVGLESLCDSLFDNEVMLSRSLVQDIIDLCRRWEITRYDDSELNELATDSVD